MAPRGYRPAKVPKNYLSVNGLRGALSTKGIPIHRNTIHSAIRNGELKAIENPDDPINYKRQKIIHAKDAAEFMRKLIELHNRVPFHAASRTLKVFTKQLEALCKELGIEIKETSKASPKARLKTGGNQRYIKRADFEKLQAHLEKRRQEKNNKKQGNNNSKKRQS